MTAKYWLDDPYCVADHPSKVAIPSRAIKGRLSRENGGFARRGRFVASFDTESLQLRIDHIDEPSFYLEVDLMQIPEIAYAPGSPFAVDLATRFNANAGINELDVMFLAWAATGFA